MAQYFNTEGLDPTLPDVTLKIGGKDRRLTFDYASMVLAEKLAGVNLLSGTFDASFSTIGPMLYAALRHDEPELELEDVSGWVHFRNAPVIYEAVLAAWTGSVPKAKSGEATAQAAAPSAA